MFFNPSLVKITSTLIRRATFLQNKVILSSFRHVRFSATSATVSGRRAALRVRRAIAYWTRCIWHRLEMSTKDGYRCCIGQHSGDKADRSARDASEESARRDRCDDGKPGEWSPCSLGLATADLAAVATKRQHCQAPQVRDIEHARLFGDGILQWW